MAPCFDQGNGRCGHAGWPASSEAALETTINKDVEGRQVAFCKVAELVFKSDLNHEGLTTRHQRWCVGSQLCDGVTVHHKRLARYKMKITLSPCAQIKG